MTEYINIKQALSDYMEPQIKSIRVMFGLKHLYIDYDDYANEIYQVMNERKISENNAIDNTPLNMDIVINVDKIKEAYSLDEEENEDETPLCFTISVMVCGTLFCGFITSIVILVIHMNQ